MDTFGHPSKKHEGTSYTFASGTLGNVSGFDAAFFGISPREAAQMDPQQRLLLELAWESFENAGIQPSSVKGSKCGVFIGISSADYAMRFADDLGAVDSTVATGNTSSIAANRISYLFDLRGPSMSIDTACSSSLVAFHQACQSIAVGETAMAIAGGVSLLLHPYGFIAFSKASMLSRKGTCSVFDAAADGYVRSEGGGIFVLKDHEQALADGNHILALVAGTNVNSDGKKSGLTVPSTMAQSALLTEAYAKAGISPSDISYLEAHGTGTPVGDPIEAKALSTALGQLRAKDQPLLIGSIKSNLGHMEAASGVAGLVKAIHCIRYRTVPASIHFNTPNPNIPFQDWNLKVVSQNTALPATGRLVIGVNGFGFGGTNAHIILESPVAKISATRPKLSQELNPVRIPLFVSGKSEAALRDAAKQFAALLRDNPVVDLYDVAYNAALKREWHEHRAVVYGGTPHSVASALAAFAENQPAKLPVVTATGMGTVHKVAFIYSGNGSQWEGMGRQLLTQSTTFKSAVQAVEGFFEKFESFSLEEELNGNNGPGRYDRTEIAQPALFAIQVGVTEMLRSQGVMPGIVAGHSVGEVAAAWAAGALTLEQAVQVIYYRSHFQGMTKGQGQMTAVALGPAQMLALLEEAGLAQRIAIASINSGRGVTLAGHAEALTELESVLATRQVIFKRLDLDYAFHSPAMDPIQVDLEQALQAIEPQETSIDFVSTVTGQVAPGTQLDARYWWQNIRQQVLFEQAIGTMLQMGVDLFVEVGPHAVLSGYLNESLKTVGSPGRVIATLKRGDDSTEQVWRAASEVMLAGGDVGFSHFFPHPGRFAELPNYPWQRERQWQTVTPESYQLLQRRKVHPLLGYTLPQQKLAWENQIDPLQYPELADHVVSGSVVFPGAGYAELGLAVAAQWQEKQGLPVQLEIEELEIKMFMVLSADSTKLMRTTLEPSDGSFTVASRDQFSTDAWTVHAVGRVRTEPIDALFAQDESQIPDRLPDFDAQSHADLTRQVGLHYGPSFQAISTGWVVQDIVWARFDIPDSVSVSMPQALLQPALLDCGFQLVFHLLKNQTNLQSGMAYLPTKIGRLSLCTGMGAPTTAKAQLVRQSPYSLTAHFTLFDDKGKVIACVRDVRFRAVPIGGKHTAPLSLLAYTAIAAAHPKTETLVPEALARSLPQEMLAPSQAHSSDNPGLLYAHQVEPLLAALCTSFAVEAFHQLADHDQVLSAHTYELLANMHAESSVMLGRLVAILEQDQLLDHLDTGWKLRDTSGVHKSTDIWHALIADHPDYFAAINAVSRIGLNLLPLIQGQTTMAQLLPDECTFASMVAKSMGAYPLEQTTQALRVTLQACLTQLTEGQRLRVVEISNGLPSISPSLMSALPSDRCQFTFASTLAETLDDYQRHPQRLRALALKNISQTGTYSTEEPRAQLVLVHNNFSSLQEAQIALDFAAAVLADQGTLLWLSAPSARWLELLFGSDTALHAAPQQWQHQLEQRGIVANDPIVFSPDSPSSAFALLALGLARAQNPAEEAAQPAESSVWLVLAGESGLSQQLTSQLVQALPLHGDTVIVAAPEIDLCDVAAVSALLVTLKNQYRKLNGVVHLYGLLANGAELSATELLEHQLQRSAIATTLVQACEATQTRTTCWLVTQGAATRLLPGRTTEFDHTVDSPLHGLGRTLLNEPSYLGVRLLDLEPAPAGAPLSPAVVEALLAELTAPDAEREVILTASGERFAPRLLVEPRNTPVAKPVAGPNTVRLSFSTPGQLRHLHWVSAPRSVPKADEVVIQVEATGLNFRDVMYALGMLSDEAVESGFTGPTLGLECAGVVTEIGSSVAGVAAGDRVLAFGASCFSNQVTTRASAVAVLPADMSFEAATTIPITFFTAYYALHHLARLQRGERVLIHGAAGGVGIAAIQIAKHLGAVVFATVGSSEKRDFVRLLGVDHILDSRSLAYADQIMALTQGQGIDVVLNSLAGEAINRNLGILKPFGRFLELGKRDFYENTKVGLRPFRNNIAYFGIDADQLLQAQPALTESLFKDMLALFSQGILHPLPFQAYEADNVVDAFRQMQQARHIGKVVVTYRNGINHVHTPNSVHSPLQLNANATYLITGGLGGFGLKTAQWLASKGARHLVLISRSGPVSAETITAVATLKEQGIKVLAQACDVTNQSALASLFETIAATMPPLRGVVHAAVVIDDALARNTTPEQLANVFKPKILGARHLHDLTQELPLDFFVMYSSATTLFGNPGQGAYVAANAYLEALAQARRSAGLTALCVGWGAIDDVGFLARNQKIKDALQTRMGGKTILSSDALDLLEELLTSRRSDVGVMELNWSALSRFLPSAAEPKFSDLAAMSDGAQSSEADTYDIRHLLEELSPEELTAAIQDLLKAEIAEILRLAPDKIDANRSLYDMGLDSLMGVELVLAIESRFGIQLSVMALSEGPTISKLTEKLISQLKNTSEISDEAAADTLVTSQVKQAVSQHAAELDSQAIQLLTTDIQTGVALQPQRIIQ
jgi:acyl transferase domain-containing protein/NADPH:quinone reductase-like Zn-dependent oxidoreductase/acyl carrier protein